MAAGQNTFINEMLKYCGFQNIFAEGARYPEFSLEELKHKTPEYILLSSEPYPFKEKHVSELKKLCPDTTVMTVDGEMFSWYGSRLRKAPEYFRTVFQNRL
jgi:hypothetical protein